MRALPLLLGLALVVTAGCLEAYQAQVDRLRGEEPLPENFHGTWEADVGPSHAASYEVPVQARANSLTVVVTLATASGSVPQPPGTPAQLTVMVEDPSGQPVGEPRVLDPRTREAEFFVTAFSGFGTYLVNVEGRGLGGGGYGARYTVTADVVY